MSVSAAGSGCANGTERDGRAGGLPIRMCLAYVLCIGINWKMIGGICVLSRSRVWFCSGSLL